MTDDGSECVAAIGIKMSDAERELLSLHWHCGATSGAADVLGVVQDRLQ
jgi:hypothetical protein